MRASILSPVLLTVLMGMVSSRALADTSGQSPGNPHMEQTREAHSVSPAANKFAVARASNAETRVSSLLDSNLSGARISTVAGASGDDAAATRPTLSNLSLRFRRSEVEETVRQFRHEGLPLARLWQSESSALNLGLNPKGKPGLWFVKRMP